MSTKKLYNIYSPFHLNSLKAILSLVLIGIQLTKIS